LRRRPRQAAQVQHAQRQRRRRRIDRFASLKRRADLGGGGVDDRRGLDDFHSLSYVAHREIDVLGKGRFSATVKFFSDAALKPALLTRKSYTPPGRLLRRYWPDEFVAAVVFTRWMCW